MPSHAPRIGIDIIMGEVAHKDSGSLSRKQEKCGNRNSGVLSPTCEISRGFERLGAAGRKYYHEQSTINTRH